jgi:hypothetical protein
VARKVMGLVRTVFLDLLGNARGRLVFSREERCPADLAAKV